MPARLADHFRQRGIPMLELGAGTAAPLRFSDAVGEHLATRRNCGLFDFSFMACMEIAGPESAAFLQRLQTRGLWRLAPGRLAYTLMLRPDGTVLNDATLWCLDARRYWLITGRRSDFDHVLAHSRGLEVSVTDRSREQAVLAIQGPRSRMVIDRCLSGLPPVLPYYTFCDARFEDSPCKVARIGYSGESGYELIVSDRDGLRLWQALLAAGRDCGIAECGFESADSLRIEAGHVLFTHELALCVSPFELGFGRLLDFYSAPATGMQPLRALRWKAPPKRLVGLVPESGDSHVLEALWARADRPQFPIKPGSAIPTSSCMSPIFGRPLGLGFVDPEDGRPGQRVSLGRGLRACVARLPFYDPARLLPRR